VAKGRDSEALVSVSGQRKIINALARGWRPGAGPVRRFLRRRRKHHPPALQQPVEGEQ